MNKFILGYIVGSDGRIDISHVDTFRWLLTTFGAVIVVFSLVIYLCYKASQP